MSDVVDLNAERLKRDEEAGRVAHERGEAWAFHRFNYSEDSVGYIDGEYPVVLLSADDGAWGICMTKADAELVVQGLTAALKSPHAPWNASPLSAKKEGQSDDDGGPSGHPA